MIIISLLTGQAVHELTELLREIIDAEKCYISGGNCILQTCTAGCLV